MNFASACFRALELLRAQRSQLHAITNVAAIPLTANLALAVGAQPSVTFHPEQIAGFIGRTDALLINMGIWDEVRAQAVPRALSVAQARGLAWVLDPVKVDRSSERCAEARGFLQFQPAIIRANRAELGALFGANDDAALMKAAKDSNVVIAASGPVDMVTDGTYRFDLHNGHELMDRVTAMGCAGTALIAALTAVEQNPLHAASFGLALMGVAGEMAGERAQGPGSFAVAFLDVLYHLGEADLAARLRVEKHG